MKNHGISNGLIAGLVGIVLYLGYYFINPDLLFNFWLGFIVGLAVWIYFMRKAGMDTKADNGGFLTFKEGLKPTFLTFVVGSLLTVLFSYVLFNMIDPSLNDLMKEKSLEMAEKMSSMFGASEEAVEAMREQMEEQDMSMSIGRLVQQYLIGLIFPGFILALIISAVIKKKPAENEVV